MPDRRSLLYARCETAETAQHKVPASFFPSVVAGLVDKPVIGVPVSTGYGYMGQGAAALASMLQSCAVITVVNIDAGFTAGAFAARIAALIGGKK